MVIVLVCIGESVDKLVNVYVYVRVYKNVFTLVLMFIIEHCMNKVGI